MPVAAPEGAPIAPSAEAQTGPLSAQEQLQKYASLGDFDPVTVDDLVTVSSFLKTEVVQTGPDTFTDKNDQPLNAADVSTACEKYDPEKRILGENGRAVAFNVLGATNRADLTPIGKDLFRRFADEPDNEGKSEGQLMHDLQKHTAGVVKLSQELSAIKAANKASKPDDDPDAKKPAPKPADKEPADKVSADKAPKKKGTKEEDIIVPPPNMELNGLPTARGWKPPEKKRWFGRKAKANDPTMRTREEMDALTGGADADKREALLQEELRDLTPKARQEAIARLQATDMDFVPLILDSEKKTTDEKPLERGYKTKPKDIDLNKWQLGDVEETPKPKVSEKPVGEAAATKTPSEDLSDAPTQELEPVIVAPFAENPYEPYESATKKRDAHEMSAEAKRLLGGMVGNLVLRALEVVNPNTAVRNYQMLEQIAVNENLRREAIGKLVEATAAQAASAVKRRK